MPNRQYKKVFRDTEKLDQLKELRKQGLSISAIARHFSVDHTSIIYQLRKHNIHQLPNYVWRNRKWVHKYSDIVFEPINKGLGSYRAYLTQSKRVSWKQYLKKKSDS